MSVNRSNTPENSSWQTTGSVCEPDFVAPAMPMNCGVFIVGPVRDVPVVGRKLPMCTATGVSVSCASAQNASSSGAGSSEPFGNAEITTPRWPSSMTALHLGDGVVDAGGGEDALADEATVGAFAELGEPVVVGADARHLQLGLGAVDLGAEEGHARVEHLQVHPVDVHVGEARLGVEASRPHRLVAHADGREVEERQARGGGEAHRADALAVVERPVVAVVAVDHLRRTVLVLRGHALPPRCRAAR